MLKKVTLSADKALIEQACHQAALCRRTLNDLFQEWLEQYVAQPQAADQYERLMEQLSHIQVGQHVDRDALNER